MNDLVKDGYNRWQRIHRAENRAKMLKRDAIYRKKNRERINKTARVNYRKRKEGGAR